MALSSKHKAFAEFCTQGFSGTESYRKTYTSCTKDSTARANSSKLLKKPEIQEYMDTIMDDISGDRIATANEVLEFLTEQMRSKFTSTKERVKCAELIGKRYRLFTDKIDANITQTVIFEGEDDLED